MYVLLNDLADVMITTQQLKWCFVNVRSEAYATCSGSFTCIDKEDVWWQSRTCLQSQA
jgi:hypothetical protein